MRERRQLRMSPSWLNLKKKKKNLVKAYAFILWEGKMSVIIVLNSDKGW